MTAAFFSGSGASSGFRLGTEAGDDVGAAPGVGLEPYNPVPLSVLEQLAKSPVPVVGLVEGGLFSLHREALREKERAEGWGMKNPGTTPS